MGLDGPRSHSDAISLEVRRVVGLAVQALPLQPTRGADFRASEPIGKVGVELGLLRRGFRPEVYYFTALAMELREYCVEHDDCLANPELGGTEVQISNARGHVNGWTSRGNVFGVLVRVEP